VRALQHRLTIDTNRYSTCGLPTTTTTKEEEEEEERSKMSGTDQSMASSLPPPPSSPLHAAGSPPAATSSSSQRTHQPSASILLAALPDTRELILEHVFLDRISSSDSWPKQDFRVALGQHDIVDERIYVGQTPHVGMSVELSVTKLMLWYLGKLNSSSKKSVPLENLNAYWLRAMRPSQHANLTLSDAFKVLKRFGMASPEEFPVFDVSFRQDWSELERNREMVQRIGRRHIDGYASIRTLHGLMFALNHCGPCVVTLPKYNEGHYWYLPDLEHETEQIRNRTEHTVLVVAWIPKERYFVLRDVRGPTGGMVEGCTVWSIDHFGLQIDLKCILPPKDVHQSLLCGNLPFGPNRYRQLNMITDEVRRHWMNVGAAQTSHKFQIEQQKLVHEHQRQMQVLQQQIRQTGSTQPSPPQQQQQQQQQHNQPIRTGKSGGGRGGSGRGRTATSAAAAARNEQEGEEEAAEERAGEQEEETAEAAAAGEEDEDSSADNLNRSRMSQFVSIASNALMARHARRAQEQANQHSSARRAGMGGGGGGGENANKGSSAMTDQVWSLVNKAIDKMQGSDGAASGSGGAGSGGGGDGVTGNPSSRQDNAQLSPPMKTAMKLLGLLAQNGLGDGAVANEDSDPSHREYRQLKAKYANQPRHPYDEMLAVGSLVMKNMNQGIDRDHTRREVVLHVFDSYGDFLMQEVRKALFAFLDPSNPLWRVNLEHMMLQHPWLNSAKRDPTLSIEAESSDNQTPPLIGTAAAAMSATPAASSVAPVPATAATAAAAAAAAAMAATTPDTRSNRELNNYHNNNNNFEVPNPIRRTVQQSYPQTQQPPPPSQPYVPAMDMYEMLRLEQLLSDEPSVPRQQQLQQQQQQPPPFNISAPSGSTARPVRAAPVLTIPQYLAGATPLDHGWLDALHRGGGGSGETKRHHHGLVAALGPGGPSLHRDDPPPSQQ